MVRHQQVMLPDTGNVDGYESSDIRLVIHNSINQYFTTSIGLCVSYIKVMIEKTG